jgi:hypothetical protein
MATVTDTEKESRRYRIDPPGSVVSQNFRYHGPGDLVLGVIALVTIFTTVKLTNWIVGAPVTIVLLLLFVHLDEGRMYAIGGTKLLDRHIRHAKRHTLWRAGKKRPKYPLPFKIDQIGDVGDERLALIRNTDKQTISLVIGGDGAEMVGQSIAAQHMYTQMLAEATKIIAATAPGVKTYISWMVRRRPKNMIGQIKSFGNNVLATVLQSTNGDGTGLQHRMQTYARQLLAMVEDSAGDVDMVAVITLQMDRALGGPKGKGVSERELSRMAARKIAEIAVSQFAGAGVANPHALTRKELVVFLRGGWDIVHLNEFHAAQLLDPTAEDIWPDEHVRVYPDHVDIDGSLHAVIRLRANNIPLPIIFRRIFATAVPFVAFTQIAQTISGRSEEAGLERYISAREGVRTHFGIIREGPRARHKAEELERQEETVFEHGFRVFFSYLICVSASDTDELDNYVDALIAATDVLGMRGKRVRGETLLWLSFLSAITGVNYL